MKDYLQPDFYRFNEDSLRLVREITEKIQHVDSLLDMGAGSGVIGLELARKLSPSVVDFVELQKEWEVFLSQNIKDFLPGDVHSEIFWESFSAFRPVRKYDLITCNPPYYLPGKGIQSPDPVRARCRSFLEDNWESLFSKCLEALSENGQAWFVAPSENRLLIEKTAAGRMEKFQFVWI